MTYEEKIKDFSKLVKKLLNHNGWDVLATDELNLYCLTRDYKNIRDLAILLFNSYPKSTLKPFLSGTVTIKNISNFLFELYLYLISQMQVAFK